MKKKIALLFVLYSMTVIYGQEKLKRTIIKELENEFKYNLIDAYGYLFLELNVYFEDSYSVKSLFLIDTGTGKSIVFDYNSEIYWKYLVALDNDGIYLVCNAKNSNLIIENLKLKYRLVSDAAFMEYKDLIRDYDLIGVLGTDFLFSNSIFISPLEHYMFWTNNLDISKAIKSDYKVFIERCFKGEQLYQCPGIILKDDCFSSITEDYRFYTLEGYSKYIIDTGSYGIFTPEIDMKNILKDKKIKSFLYKYSDGSFNICNISSFNYLGKNLNNITGYSYFPRAEGSKIFGMQVLSAYNMYFYLDEEGVLKNVYFFETDEEKYLSYRKKNDCLDWLNFYPYGFIANNDNGVFALLYKDGKPVLTNVNIGDSIISINDEKFDYKKNYSDYPKIVKFTFRDKNNKYYKVKIRKMDIN